MIAVSIIALLIETATLTGIEPFSWLSEVVTRIVDGDPAAVIGQSFPLACQNDG
ncbi:transposase domain-containing protein [Gluconacetobacter diazotrophicus]|uniref:Transposase domain-containing protein n=1 Tax=Gluconacetobacter diazotrophicus TaxID=33996 RepID=A0A7W4FF69_GLUDI|nr:transposase domain-containing protein [Gluconacetobacter diazotrophicus]MBB2156597.1 transposase domain-containing protein [Gluconacetobacter diazotrophicus]